MEIPFRVTIFVAIIALIFQGGVQVMEGQAALQPPESSPVTGPASVGRYATAEYRFSLDLPAGLNPFDPRDADIRLEMETPSGKASRQNAFFLGTDENRHSLWAIRFAPLETGAYALSFKASMGGMAETALPGPETLLSTPSSLKGFVRVDPVSRQYLVYDSGQDYLGVGLSVT